MPLYIQQKTNHNKKLRTKQSESKTNISEFVWIEEHPLGQAKHEKMKLGNLPEELIKKYVWFDDEILEQKTRAMPEKIGSEFESMREIFEAKHPFLK